MSTTLIYNLSTRVCKLWRKEVKAICDLLFGDFEFIFYLIHFVHNFFIYRFLYNKHGNNQKAIYKTIIFSTLFFIIGTLLIILSMFGSYFIGYILIGFLLLLGFILILQWKYYNEVILLKGVKIVWRFSFLIFLASYLILI